MLCDLTMSIETVSQLQSFCQITALHNLPFMSLWPEKHTGLHGGTRRHGDTETRRHGDTDRDRETQTQRQTQRQRQNLFLSLSPSISLRPILSLSPALSNIIFHTTLYYFLHALCNHPEAIYAYIIFFRTSFVLSHLPICSIAKTNINVLPQSLASNLCSSETHPTYMIQPLLFFFMSYILLLLLD